jgi:hypothetical protein
MASQEGLKESKRMTERISSDRSWSSNSTTKDQIEAVMRMTGSLHLAVAYRKRHISIALVADFRYLPRMS